MITAHISIRRKRRIYIRHLYLGNCWNAAINAIRDCIRTSGSTCGKMGLAISTVTGHTKVVTARTVKEI